MESKNAEMVYGKIENTLFNRHGAPTIIRSDNGTEFNGLAATSQQMAANGVAAPRTTRTATEWSNAKTCR